MPMSACWLGSLLSSVFLLAATCSDPEWIDSEDWAACSCGALRILSLEGAHSGIVLEQRRQLHIENALLEQFGGTDAGFAFVFDDPESGIILDRSEIGADIRDIFHASNFGRARATDFGVIMERAAEIHVVDSCFAFLPAILQVPATTRKVLHRYASPNRTAQGGGTRCPRIEHSRLPSLVGGWQILEHPRGALHLDPQVVHPPNGDVVVVGSEIDEFPGESVMFFSVRKVRSLPPDVTIVLRHNAPPGEFRGLQSTTPQGSGTAMFFVTLSAAPEGQPRCPSINGVPMTDLDVACEAAVQVDVGAQGVLFGHTFSALTLSVRHTISSTRVSWFTMASADGDPELHALRGDFGGSEQATGEEKQAACPELDVFFLEEYLPSQECLAGGGRSASEERLLPCVDAMEEALAARQLGREGGCAGVKAAGFANYGLGSTLHYLLLQLHRAAVRGERIAFIGEWVYGGCAAKDFSCAFEAWSPCAVPPGHPIDAAYPRFEPARQDPDAEFSACVGEHPNGRFHYATVLAAFLWRPNAHMRRAAGRARAGMGLPKRYLGVHVRHGDFCIASKVVEHESKECFSVLAYAEALQRMADAYGVRDVFVASDNQQSLEMLRQWSPGLRLYWQREVDRSFLEATVEDFEKEQLWVESKLFKSSDARRMQHLIEIMVDVILLLGSFGFVGQFSSNISRLVVEVNSRRNKRIMPYISLDLPFCYNGGRGQAIWLEDGTMEKPPGKNDSTAFWYC